MSAKIRSVEYFYTTVYDRPGEGCRILNSLAEGGVNLLAFTAVPVGPERTQIVLFPDNVDKLVRLAEDSDFVLTGPHRAFLVQGDDRLGALVEIHRKLCDENINVYSSSGVTDGKGGYGYIMHVKPEDYDNAARVLDV
ncbi:MAG: hypothetical protein GTO42_01465 [Candidatus Latescibacteria bacterium]|nr:hypothetical protein [Candidatus Latescibacterota bacterium]NIO27198.1 hypothetical protein [Candidatus Latescibacterota bacterium]NIO54722.1 hypothetical protein [Candidatus Latescibacterota bacterium]NIT00805.1 hypothetical protein [Candidatus Latescibacterota bacterium]NIT37728.1 hypothetical protein [Candidatus Latescibacterota bacterium]